MVSIGTTPLVELLPGIKSKLEYLNPGGSHKTRAAEYLLRSGIADGTIVPGVTTVIEKTGGNFGLGLAVGCARQGVPLELAVGLGFSALKKRALERAGAFLIGNEMLHQGATPREVVDWHLENQDQLGKNYFYTNQFGNERCVDAHFYTTGVELTLQLQQLDVYGDTALTLVSGAGTGATMTGVGRRLRQEFPDTKIVLVEPEGSSVRANKHTDHRMEGISVGVVPPFLQLADVDQFMICTEDEMTSIQNEIARTKGVLIGNSAAGVLGAARRYKAQNADRVVITLVYDEGHWYL